MNPAQLLAHFDRIGEAPDAVPRLRQFILDLAVRGKLVERDPNDEPAQMLIARLIKRGGPDNRQGRKSEMLPAITSSDIPFAIPSGWAWERLGNVGETNIGLTYSPQDVSAVGFPVLRSSNIQNGKLDFADLVRVQTEPKPSVMLQDGDLLICARNGSRALVGKVALIENLKEPSAFGAFMAIFRSQINKYLYHFICSPLFRQVISEVNTTTINQITQNNLRSTLAPIPPLAEQHRIVAKVDELMALCDRLQAARAERESRRDRLAAASLHRLNQPAETDSPEVFREHARFYLNHLPRLTTRADQIKQLRQTILNLAARGRLVPQDPNDEPASQCLKRIQAKKARLLEAGKIRVQEPLPPVLGDEVPFESPRNWEWVPLAGVLCSSFYGPRFGADEYCCTGIPTIRTTDMTLDGRIVLRDPPRVSVPVDRLEDYRCEKGDLLITRTGSIGTMAVFGGDYAAIPSAYLIRLRFGADTSVDYVHLVLRSPYGQAALGLNTTKVAQPNINAKNLAAILIPFPPLAEQYRIVAKVNELMALSDQLETQLTTALSEIRHLLEAVLHEALAQTAAMSSPCHPTQVHDRTGWHFKNQKRVESIR